MAERGGDRRCERLRRGRAGGGGDGVPAAARWAEFPATDGQRTSSAARTSGSAAEAKPREAA
ncbi:hypothetical protein Scep_024061 [Stephania cephalantha]|uniref:Uncharacterized protein n=1 Tax=Stephania cephalantha TaxID=152367 RepID=A0AAP0EWY7_9MAGN